MGKTTLNRALVDLRGSVDGWCYRKTRHGTVVMKKPDMSRVKWSPKQEAHRARVAEAGRHYRKVMAEPKEAARLRKLAKKQGMPVSTYVISAYLRKNRQATRGKAG
jgi:DNA-binding GntR family transcriptional regulator